MIAANQHLKIGKLLLRSSRGRSSVGVSLERHASVNYTRHLGTFLVSSGEDRHRSQQADHRMDPLCFISIDGFVPNAQKQQSRQYQEHSRFGPTMFQRNLFSTATHSPTSSTPPKDGDQSGKVTQTKILDDKDDLPPVPDGLDEQTWRERFQTGRENLRDDMSERREQGRAAAKKGAKSFGEMARRYGPVFVWTYGGMYFGALGLFYTGIDSGLVDVAYVVSIVSPSAEGEAAKSSVDVVVEFMDHYAWTRQFVPFFERHPGFANLGVAWIAVKFTEPIRFGLTVAIVPRLARYFGYTKPDETPEEEEPVTKAEESAHDPSKVKNT